MNRARGRGASHDRAIEQASERIGQKRAGYGGVWAGPGEEGRKKGMAADPCARMPASLWQFATFRVKELGPCHSGPPVVHPRKHMVTTGVLRKKDLGSESGLGLGYG